VPAEKTLKFAQKRRFSSVQKVFGQWLNSFLDSFLDMLFVDKGKMGYGKISI